MSLSHEKLRVRKTLLKIYTQTPSLALPGREKCLIPYVTFLCKLNFEGETFSAAVYKRLWYTRISTDAFH